ncbi:hypothetical protein CWE15_02225 [Aliidiomarina taiwanensis]|uniref:DUF2878 domain-containing protein n=1 Tax=Aliidiomarina taiwanensis TaxID=946228 RepID=A0A432X9I2_9GAMM|nr:DUF2878 domain-containing protein [Aliidiomarina taiwanensis]RUO44019.1 hypothetical protein CWE15_02225 [Aliidiomarina taiwanensis]
MQTLIQLGLLRRIIPFFLFDIVWFLAVWGRDAYVLINTVLVLCLFLFNGRQLVAQAKPLILFVLFGLGAELLFVMFHVIRFTQTDFLPFWLVVLWLGFSATAFSSMDWLAGRYVLAALLGAVFGPVTYLAGVRFGAAQIQISEPHMIFFYAVAWSVLMLVFARLVKQDPHPAMVRSHDG